MDPNRQVYGTSYFPPQIESQCSSFKKKDNQVLLFKLQLSPSIITPTIFICFTRTWKSCPKTPHGSIHLLMPPRVAPEHIAHSYVWCLMALFIFLDNAIETKPILQAQKKPKKSYETESTSRWHITTTNSLKK